MPHTPSAAQLKAYQSRTAQRPVVLYYQYATPERASRADALAKLAKRHRGRLRWSGSQVQVLIGALPLYQHGARLHFLTRSAALAHVQSPQHAELFKDVEALQVAVMSEPPRLARLLIALMAFVLPRWPFDNRLDEGPEPGLGTSILPTDAALQEFLAHPDQDTPIVMVNWLRFRARAQYAPGHADAAAISGQAAYYRYGKVAFLTLHSLGARALFVSRYQQMLIGNAGDPGAELWHEFAMVEYPGRATFKRMTALRRYRAALHHRSAGLDEQGQGLVVAESETR